MGILLLTIYPEIKRDVVSCLYESDPRGALLVGGFPRPKGRQLFNATPSGRPAGVFTVAPDGRAGRSPVPLGHSQYSTGSFSYRINIISHPIDDRLIDRI